MPVLRRYRPGDMARPRTIPPARLAPTRATTQLLHRPAAVRHPADVARAICGAQAQDLPAGRLAFRARSARLRASDVDRARNQERSLIRTWAMRGTLHLIATEDFGWLVPLFESRFVEYSRRRLAQLDMPAGTQERAIREVQRALRVDGPQTRGALSERLEHIGISLNPQTRLHVFRL